MVLHDPSRLILLKETGQCEVDLPETLFDADYPGHYFRRIKSASLSIPCVAGPYTSVNCTLTLLASRIRTSPTGDSSTYPENPIGADPRFVYNHMSMESIATSHAQNDAGLFELNFRDERFLPFEGAGAISRWRIELPKHNNAFDFGSISDVVLNLSYTARGGGQRLQQAARAALEELIVEVNKLTPPLQRLFLIRHEFPDAWHRFLHGSDPLTLQLDATRFPYLFRGRGIQAVGVDFYLQFEDTEGPSPTDLQLALSMPGEQFDPATTAKDLDWTQPWDESEVWLSHIDPVDSQDALGTWTLTSHGGTQELREKLHDLAVVISYVVGGRSG